LTTDTTPAETPADTSIDDLKAELDRVKAEVTALNAQSKPASTPTAYSPAVLTGTGRVFKVLHDAIGSEGTYGPFYKGETVFESQIGPYVDFILGKGALQPLTLTADGRHVSEAGAPAPASRLGELETKLTAVNDANAKTDAGKKTAKAQAAAVAAQSTAIAQEQPVK
jgi:hypothetical protein